MARIPATENRPDRSAAARRLHFDPLLVEESVRIAVEATAVDERRRFHAEREPLYDIADPELRESGFRELHRRWFARLGIARELVRVLNEQSPALDRRVARWLVLWVASAREEYADLRDRWRGDAAAQRRNPVAVLRLRPRTLIDPERLAGLLGHELLHLADMLDPGFGFDPELPLPDGSGPFENLVRHRYRVLWDTTIDGRLAAAGRLPSGGGEARRAEFLTAFSMLGESADRWFERFFGPPRPSHPEIVGFAVRPGDAAGSSGRCPICGMPGPAVHRPSPALTPPVAAAIQRDHPAWRPAEGACLRCLEVYEVQRPAG